MGIIEGAGAIGLCLGCLLAPIIFLIMVVWFFMKEVASLFTGGSKSKKK